MARLRFLRLCLAAVVVWWNFLYFVDGLGLQSSVAESNSTCSKSQFECDNGNCVDEEHLCDHLDDCGDNSDEKETHCLSASCGESQFECMNGNCVDDEHLCDHLDDCGDNSDEMETHCLSASCGQSQFECDNGNCVDDEHLCDHLDDCGDNSDEMETVCSSVKCGVMQFNCDNGNCVDDEHLCDHLDDCGDNSDEKETHCVSVSSSCGESQFECDNWKCVDMEHVCDHVNDCGDNSDEKETFCEESTCKNPSHFQCDDRSACFNPLYVCDGSMDCKDGSDEKNNCKEKCFDLHCDDHCFPTEKGVRCTCKKGHKLQADGKKCKKIDFCNSIRKNGLPYCSQKCHAYIHDAICNCFPGYSIAEDESACKADGDEAIVYFANVSDIWALTFDSKVSKRLISRRDGINGINGIAVDSHEQNIFWSESGTDKPAVCSMNLVDMQRKIQTIKSFGLVKPMGLSFDYLARNLYITDSLLPAIFACELRNHVCTQVFNSSFVDSPRDIAVYPSERMMYWTDVGKKAAILKGGMNGVGIEVLVSKRIRRPVSLFIDLTQTTKKLFWTDEFYNEVYSIALDGGNRKTVITHKVSLPVGMVVFEDWIIWANGASHNILMANKFNSHPAGSLVEFVSRPSALTIGHKSLQYDYDINRCKLSDCDLCLLGPDDPSCFCSEGYVPTFDGQDCERDERSAPFLLASSGSEIIQISFNFKEIMETSFIKTDSTNIFTLAYSSKDNTIFYSDKDRDNKVYINELQYFETNPYSKVVMSGIRTVQSLAFDDGAANLYWIDIVKRTIEIASASKYRARLPIAAIHPVALTLNPEEATLYYSDLVPACIHQCRLDGTECSPLVRDRLEEPNYLLYSNSKLFWSDRSLHEISYVDLNQIDGKDGKYGKDRFRVVITRNPPLAFAIHKNVLFWTEIDSTSIFYIHFNKAHNYKSHIETQKLNLAGLIMAVPNSLYQTHCSIDDGKCDHICISGKNSSSCLCSNGYRLAEDGRGCLQIPDLEQNCDGVFCMKENICIHAENVCNKIPDCSDKSDEMDCETKLKCDSYRCDDGHCVPSVCDCPSKSDSELKRCPEKGTCPSSEHWCGSFCLSSDKLCDKTMDCADGSDEADCSYQCLESEFKCDICISIDYKCDGDRDCRNGEDEQDCHPVECTKDQFQCRDKRCIDNQEVCDGMEDCDEGEDENSVCSYSCSPDEFLCPEKKCIDKSFLCDGVANCKFGEDETLSQCPECKADEFACWDDSCIPLSQKCDRKENCPDGSDEIGCPLPLPEVCDGFKCRMGQCIAKNKKCNGEPDCSDNSDEFNCGLTCEEFQQKGKCQHSCETSMFGPRCTCEQGYKLVGQFECTDIDECTEGESICSQSCQNYDGAVHSLGYKCTCHAGYLQTKDFFFCKAKGQRPIIYSVSYNGIKQLSLDGKNERVLVQNLTRPELMDVDIQQQTIYWVENDHFLGRRELVKHKLWKQDDRHGKEMLLSDLTISGLAYDWITRNIYLSHMVQLQGRISVMNEQRFRATIVSDTTYRPGQIVLHPFRSKMFWVSQHKNPARLMRSSMDGSSIKIIVESIPHGRNMLAVDANLDRIYWYDMYMEKMVSGDLNGQQRHYFDIPGTRSIYSLDAFESILYMTNSSDKSIVKFPMYGTKENQKTSKLAHSVSKFIKVVHPLRQLKSKNPCSGVLCTFMCVQTDSGSRSRCLCPDGYGNKTNSDCVGLIHLTVPETILRPKTPPSPKTCSLKCQKGRCVTEGTKELCLCVPGYKGDLCELDMHGNPRNATQALPKDEPKERSEEGGSKLWIIAVVVVLLAIVCLFAGVYCVRNKRCLPKPKIGISFNKSTKYIFTTKKDVQDDVVPEISFNNPGFQDEIDREAEGYNNAGYIRKMLARSHKSMGAVFLGKNIGKNDGGIPVDPTMGDTVSLLKNV